MSKFSNSTKDNVFFSFLKGILIGSILSFGLIVLFAYCMKWFDLSDAWISPIVLLIKGISVFVGAFFAVKGSSKGLIKGSLFGLVYILVAFVIFSFLAGEFQFTISTLLDVIFAMLLGGLVGIFKVNKK